MHNSNNSSKASQKMAAQQAIVRSAHGFFLIEFLVALAIFLSLVTTVTAYHWQIGRNHINTRRRLDLLKAMAEQMETVAGDADQKSVKNHNKSHLIQQSCSLVDPAIFEGDALFKRAVKNGTVVSMKGRTDTVDGTQLHIELTTVVLNKRQLI
jgi:Tfp pilus assembly protein PilV